MRIGLSILLISASLSLLTACGGETGGSDASSRPDTRGVDPVDAAQASGPDAASVAEDASLVSFDAALPGDDAALLGPDAAGPDPDAGAPGADAVMGDFNSWNHSDPSTAMQDLGLGRLGLAVSIATPGSHQAKFARTGTFTEGFGPAGRVSRWSSDDSLLFLTTTPNQLVYFNLDLTTGRSRVEPLPEP